MGYFENLDIIKNCEDVQKLSPAIGVEVVKFINRLFSGEKYKFARYIGKGGEAVIFLVEDAKLKRNTVLKIAFRHLNVVQSDIFYSFSNPRVYGKDEEQNILAERFKRGFTLQAQCHGICKDEASEIGYIPQVHNIADAPLFCEMEFIPGENLADWCKNQSPEEKIKLFYKMVFLVEKALHNWSIVHSDLKFNNWMVLADGRPVLLDFNAAKNKASLDSLTKTNSFAVCNELYSSPHQKNNFKDRDYKDDIFTLGTTLHIMWVEREPHYRRTLLEKIANKIDIEKNFPAHQLPHEIAKVFVKCVSQGDWGYEIIADLRKEIELILADWGVKKEITAQADDLSLAQYVEELQKENLPELHKLFESAVWEAMEHKKILREKILKGKK